MYIAHNILCFIMSTVLSMSLKKISPSLFTYPFQLSSEYVLKQEFKSKHAEKCVNIIDKS